MDLKKYRHNDWIVYFSGDKWAPLGFTSWISLYTRRPFANGLDFFVDQAVMVWDGETTTCYIRESDRKKFGEKVVKKVLKDPGYVDQICRGFIDGTNRLLAIYARKKNLFAYAEYADYNKAFLNEYYPNHIQVKNVVDFLPKDLLKKYLPKLQAARVHAEPVFSKEVGFIKKIAGYIAKKSNFPAELILFVFESELTAYWRDNKKLPAKNILKERAKSCVIFFEKGKIQKVLTGKEISEFGSIFLAENKESTLTGQTAFPGKVKGVVRIIFDPAAVKQFNQGDILVAPWTRPEYLPIMKKAGAFVTDGGGVLSHAAIVARELKKPCVIATKTATKVLKDGDVVEVDAEKGIVRKLK